MSGFVICRRGKCPLQHLRLSFPLSRLVAFVENGSKNKRTAVLVPSSGVWHSLGEVALLLHLPGEFPQRKSLKRRRVM
ncbi:hypothetical protein NL676_039432 [Syzygium grande]|nr:hypothetical protein NL676_039432 [Syzygium grande]